MNINLNEKKRFKQPFLIQDIKIGLKRKFSLKITEKLHNDFKKFSGDTSAIHNDIKFCKKIILKKLGYAFLITSALSKIYEFIFQEEMNFVYIKHVILENHFL